MKKAIFVLFIFVFVSLTSCYQKPVTPQQPQIVEQQIRVIEPEFFYIVKEVVKAGYTTWDRARVYFGSGYKWRDIVAQNKILQEPGRVWQDKVTGIWYVLIRPGEELIMGTTKVEPIFVENIDAPSKVLPVSPEPNSTIPWWGWLLIGISVIILLIVLMFWGNRNFGFNNSATSNTSVHVNLRDGFGIDAATERELLRINAFQNRVLDFVEDHDYDEMEFRNKTLKVIKRASKKGQLEKFEINENPNWFNVTARYKNGDKKKKQKKEEQK